MSRSGMLKNRYVLPADDNASRREEFYKALQLRNRGQTGAGTVATFALHLPLERT